MPDSRTNQAAENMDETTAESSPVDGPMRCPHCGSDRFDIHGSVPYTQRYYAQADSYDTSDVNWDADRPEFVECAQCYQDATQLFKKARVITRFYRGIRS
jgi:DNA-directed RNA polymerase subunit RPC12/RpoP